MDLSSSLVLLTSLLDEIANDMLIDFSNVKDFEQLMSKDKVISKVSLKINIIKSLCLNKLLNYNPEVIIGMCNSLNTLKHKMCIEYNNNNVLRIKHFYRKLGKCLGFIIYNIYRDSGCHILLSNIPK